MAYRATLDASHKVTTKGGHHAKFMRHIARDVDRANGVVHPVANDNVDWSRTQNNVTMVADGNGGFRPAKSSDELIAATDDLLAQVRDQQMPNGSWRSGIRSNSVVLRPLVLSLPNEWYDEHSPGWRDGDYSPAAERLHADIEEFALSRFPARNVPGYSWHCDESLAAQLQLPFVPLTEDGRLSQGDFFTGPKHLRELHKDFREFLRDRGHDIEMKSSERSREHLDSDEFQQRADQLREAQGKLDAREADLEEAEDDLDERTQDVAERETDWLTRKRRLDVREDEIDARDQESADARLAAQNERREAESLNAAERAEIARLRALREDVERDLTAAGPAPQQPSYEDIRGEFLGEQSGVMTKYLKRMRSKDGTTMFDDFERFAREEHAKLTRQGQPVGRYETWRDRTAAAQKRLTMAQLNDAPTSPAPASRDREIGS